MARVKLTDPRRVTVRTEISDDVYKLSDLIQDYGADACLTIDRVWDNATMVILTERMETQEEVDIRVQKVRATESDKRAKRKRKREHELKEYERLQKKFGKVKND